MLDSLLLICLRCWKLHRGVGAPPKNLCNVIALVGFPISSILGDELRIQWCIELCNPVLVAVSAEVQDVINLIGHLCVLLLYITDTNVCE